jgi:outer membrane protein assembly factor BamB
MLHRTLILVAFTLIGVPPAAAGDWPQFLGPTRNGSSEETGLPTRWSPKENIRWKADLPGRGVSGAIVARDRVYVTSASGFQETRLHLLCFDAGTGKLLWQRQLAATSNTLCHQKTSMAAPTPVSDGDRVFALFATGDLAAFDRDGNLLWYRALVKDYPTVGNNVGMAASPVVWQDTLLLAMENAGESFALAVAKLTGKNRWKVERARDINWATPLVRPTAGGAEVLFQSAKEITAYDVRTGEKRWRHEAAGLSTIPSPVQGNGLILATGGTLPALRLTGERTPPEVVWQAPKLRSGYASPVFYHGNFYGVNGTDVVTCIDGRDGKVVWQSERLKAKGPYSATPVAADNKLYLINEKGLATVLQLGDKPQVLATNDLAEEVLATPAIASGAIFIRTDKHLYCIAVKK